MGDPVVYFEIGCRDRGATSAFYQGLFDWRVTTGDTSVIATNSDRGIEGHVASLGHEPHNYTIIYVEVTDLDEAVERAESLGGRRLVGPVVISDGRFAWIADPEGNTVGMIEPAPS
jgi:hypothetical protein